MLAVLGSRPRRGGVYRLLLGRPSVSDRRAGRDRSRCRQAAGAGAVRAWSSAAWSTATGRRRFTAAPPAMALGALISQRRDGAAHGRAGTGDLRRGTPGGDGRAQHQRPDRGRHRRRRDPAPVPPGAARRPTRSAPSSPRRSSPCRPGRTRPSPPPSTAACASGWCWTGPSLAEPGHGRRNVDSLRYGVQLRVAADAADEARARRRRPRPGAAGHPAGAEPGAVLLHRSGLLAALDALFETVWRQAYPLELSSWTPRQSRR